MRWFAKAKITISIACFLGIMFILLDGIDPSESIQSGIREEQVALQSEPITVNVYVFDRKGELVGPVKSAKLQLTEKEWKRRLKPKQYEVLRAKGTELPFSGRLLENEKEGVYISAGCRLPLFSSEAKFHSGTGWPSFYQPIAKENILEQNDFSDGTHRIEVLCARCGGHLGHVFGDGPRPTGLRDCMNSVSLSFTDSAKRSSSLTRLPSE